MSFINGNLKLNGFLVITASNTNTISGTISSNATSFIIINPNITATATSNSLSQTVLINSTVVGTVNDQLLSLLTLGNPVGSSNLSGTYSYARAAMLRIYDNTHNSIALGANGGYNTQIQGANSTRNSGIYGYSGLNLGGSNDTPHVFISNIGKVGIGTVSNYKLQVSPTSTHTNLNTGDGFSIYNPDLTSANLIFGLRSSSHNIIQSRDGVSLTWGLSLQPYGGNLLIGSNSTPHLFDDRSYIGAGYGISMGYSGTGYPIIGYNITYTTTNGNIKYRNNDYISAINFTSGKVDFISATIGTSNTLASYNTNMTILNNGYVGIGTITPINKLHLTDSSNTIFRLSIAQDSNYTTTFEQNWNSLNPFNIKVFNNNLISLYYNGVNYTTNLSFGNISIGALTASSYKLLVTGDVLVQGINTSTGGALSILASDTSPNRSSIIFRSPDGSYRSAIHSRSYNSGDNSGVMEFVNTPLGSNTVAYYYFMSADDTRKGITLITTNLATNGYSKIWVGTASTSFNIGFNNTDIISLYSNGGLQFNTLTGTQSDIMIISTTGSVGRTSSSTFLSGNYFAQNGNSFGTTAVLGTNDNYPIQFKSNDIVYMTMGATSIGIGLTAATANIHVYQGPSHAGVANILLESGQSTGNGSKITLRNYNNGWESVLYHYTAAGGATQQLKFMVGGSHLMTMGNGNVGILTHTASYPLDVNGNAGIGTSDTTTTRLYFRSTTQNVINYQTGTPLHFEETSGTKRLSLVGSYIGIGTSSPSSLLHIYNGNAGNNNLQLQFQASGGGNWAINPFIVGISNGGLSFVDILNNRTPFVINASANVGIGTTTPAYTLDVAGNVQFRNTVYVGTRIQGLSGSYTNLILNDLGGNVGIGTASPLAKLHIVSSGTTSATTAFLIKNSASNNILKIKDNGAVVYGNSGYDPFIAPHAPNGGDGINPSLSNAHGLLFKTEYSGPAVSGYWVFNHPQTITGVSDVANDVVIFGGVNTSSTVSVVYNSIVSSPDINNTDGTTLVRGFYFNPTLTNTVGTTIRAIETTSGDVIFNGGNVGIGTMSASYRLDVNGNVRIASNLILSSFTGTQSDLVIISTTGSIGRTSSASFLSNNYFIRNGNSFGATATLGTNDNYGLQLETNNTTRLTIATNGNVGIGTTTPSSVAQIERFETVNRTTYNDILTITARANTNPYSGHGGGILFNGTTYINGDGITNYARIGSTLNDDSVNRFGSGLFFDVTPTDSGSLTRAMTIKYDGNVGIGTTTPAYTLDVAGNVQFRNTVYVGTRIQGLRGSYTNLILNDLGGNVGIGTITPTYKLDILGTNNAGIRIKQGGQIGLSTLTASNFSNGLVFENDGSSHAYSIGYSSGAKFTINYFDGTSTYRSLLTIDGSGNVGIGTSSAYSKLDVVGIISINGAYFGNNDTNYTFLYKARSNSIGLYLGGVGDPANYYDNTRHYFRDASTTIMGVFTVNGLSIGTNSDPTSSLYITKNSGDNLIRVNNQSSGNFWSGLSILYQNSEYFSVKGNVNTGELRLGGINPSGYYTTIYSNGDETVRVSSGKVSIGSGANAITRLDVRAASNSSITPLTSAPDTATTMLLGNVATNGVLAFGYDNNTIGWIQNRSVLANQAAGNISLNPLGGNVAIGTSSTPLYTLDVSGMTRSTRLIIDATGDNAIHFIRSGASNDFSIEHDTTRIYFYNRTTTVTAFTILNNSNIGIGTAIPIYRLDVISGATISARFDGRVIGVTAVNSNEFITLGQLAASSSNTFVQNGNSFGANAVLGTNDNNALQFETNGVVRLTIATSGNINIGGQTNNGYSHYTWDGNAYRNPYDHTPNIIRVDNSSTGIVNAKPALTLYNHNGGLDTTSHIAFATLESATAGGNSVTIAGIIAKKATEGTANCWSSGSLHLVTKNGGSMVEGMYINPNGNVVIPVGNVSIGTTLSTAKLDVNGISRFRNILDVDGTAKITGNYVSNGNVEYTYLRMYNGSDASINIGTKHALGYISFESGNGAYTERMRITNTGNIGIGTSSPAYKLDVVGKDNIVRVLSTSSISYLQIQNSNSGYSVNSDGLTIGLNGLDGYIFQREAGNLIFGTTDAERMRITATGNVGIGTNDPQYKLDVNGVVRVSGTLRAVSGGITIFNNTTGGWGYLSSNGINIGDWVTNPIYGQIRVGDYNFNVLKTDSSSLLYISNSSKYVGMGTDTPLTPLHVMVGTAGGQNFYVHPNGAGSGKYGVSIGSRSGGWDFRYGMVSQTGTVSLGGFGFYGTSNTISRYYIGNQFDDAMFSLNNTGLGIGTASTSPDHMITVMKNTNSGSNGVYPAINIDNPNASGYMEYMFTSNAAIKAGIRYINTSNQMYIYTYTGQNDILFGTGGYEQMRLSVSGNLIIGATADTGYKLDVNGTIRGANLVETSSRRYKTNIKNMKSQIHILDKLKPVTFNWKDLNKGTASQYGFIAEEVAKILPDIVSYTADGKADAISYTKLIPMLVQAVQELQYEIEKLKKNI